MNEIQELRDWAAGKMDWGIFVSVWDGQLWYFSKTDGKAVIRVDDWRPDKDANQCFMVVEKIRELGWRLSFHYPSIVEEDRPAAQFYTHRPYCCYSKNPSEWGGPHPNPHENSMTPKSTPWIYNDNPLISIIKAARATDPA